jgi:predicted NAD-dependent protein-ADP-ribosyltransferase YbiA (DUF1768 family)
MGEQMPKGNDSSAAKPLNVASGSAEWIGKQLSNFAERRFVFHGRRYRSVEGWYQGLKWPEDTKRQEIAKLLGPLAKKASKGAPRTEQFHYNGKDYAFGSPEHHQLIKEAIRASLEQNPEIFDAFLQTDPRPFVHETGREEGPGTALPGSKFVQILEEIRREFIEARENRF